MTARLENIQACYGSDSPDRQNPERNIARNKSHGKHGGYLFPHHHGHHYAGPCLRHHQYHADGDPGTNQGDRYDGGPGTNKRKIFLLVLVETVFLTLAGTPVGMGIGWIATLYFNKHGINLSGTQRN